MGTSSARRRRRHILYGATGAVLTGGVIAGGLAVGVTGAILVSGVNVVRQLDSRRPRVWFHPSDGRWRWLSRRNLYATRILPATDGPGFRVGWRSLRWKEQWFEDEDARRALEVVLPQLNSMGGSARNVQTAVADIESHRHPQRFLDQVAERGEDHKYRGVPGYILKLPKPTRLALEMALHEEQERRALEGELWRLERAWEEAEEIAAISDSLLLPKGAEDYVARHGRPPEPEGPSEV